MPNGKCQVYDGSSQCNRPAVAILKQILATEDTSSKTVRTPVCEEHAKLMEKTRGTHTVERFSKDSATNKSSSA
jgi:hypothetical protein